MTTGKNKIISSLNLCLVCLVLFGGFLFMKSLDDLIVKNLELDKYKTELDLLQEEKQENETKKNVLESHENISIRLRDLNMVAVSDITYISVGDDSLAKR